MEIGNTKVDNAKDINIVLPMYNLMKYSHNYLKTSGSLSQYHRDELSLKNNDNIVNFTGANHNSKVFKYRQKITSKTGNDREKSIKIMVLLKYLSSFWSILKMA